IDAQVRRTDAPISPNGSGAHTDVGSRPEDAPAAATAQRFDPRTRVLLEGPITSTLLRLATPNPLVAMVGTNIGAGQRDRALRAAWIGAGIAAGLTEIIGLCAAAVPEAWLSLFDTDPAMLDAGSRYLHVVGPFYGLFGLGLALYFASQGAGRLSWPLLANQIRFAIAAGGGWLALRWSGDVSYVFVALSAALAAFGLMNAGAVASGAWFGPIAWPQPRSRS